ncbi:MAG: hypothetical protein R3321_09750 [Nitrososphaeraceae archaeon]|nr:hypothetical protein [Nitrososphaeraceae archaeon]
MFLIRYYSAIAKIILFILPALLISSCNRPYELSKADKSVETINDDNLLFKVDQPIKYSVSIKKDDINYGVNTEMVNFNFDEELPLVKISDSLPYVKYFSITAQATTTENQHNDYQSNIQFDFYDNNNEWIPIYQGTGVVDNEYNIWLHPPRVSYFKLLNLSAYPYVKLPLEINKTWDFTIPIGKQWGHNSLGSQWGKSTLIFDHQYTVSDSLIINDLPCYKIDAISSSSLGISHGTFYFNEDYGFVKMIFNKLDGTEIIFDLVK